VRLRELRQELPVPVELVHRPFVLLPDEEKRHFTEYYLRHRRAAAELSGLPYHLPDVGDHYPTSSWPALEAAEWVKRAYPDRFDTYDLAIYEAFFQFTRDISDPGVLTDLARSAGIPDPDRLQDSLERRALRGEVAAQVSETERRGVRLIPTVLIGEEALVGAVPAADYRQAARRTLDDRPG